jgi:hypothetical protein
MVECLPSKHELKPQYHKREGGREKRREKGRNEGRGNVEKSE